MRGPELETLQLEEFGDRRPKSEQRGLRAGPGRQPLLENGPLEAANRPVLHESHVPRRARELTCTPEQGRGLLAAGRCLDAQCRHVPAERQDLPGDVLLPDEGTRAALEVA